MNNTAENKKLRILNKYFVIIFIVSTTSGLGMNIYASMLSLFINGLGGTETQTGYIALVFSITGLIGRFCAGYLSDRFKRTSITAAGCLIFAVGSVLYTLVPTISAITVFRGLQGFGFAILHTACTACVTDVVPRDRMSEGIGIFTMNQVVSMVFGGTLGVAVKSIFGFDFLFCLCGIMSFISMILCYFCRYDKDPLYAANTISSGKDPELLKYRGLKKYFDKDAMPATVSQFFVQMSYAAISVYIFIYAEKAGLDSSTYFIFAGLGMLLGRLVMNKYSNMVYPLPIIIPSVLICAIGSTVLALWIHTGAIVICALCTGASMGVAMPTVNSLALRNAPTNRRGVAATTFAVAQDLSGGIGPAIWGVIITAMGYKEMYLGCTISTLLGLALCIFFFNKKRLSKTLPKGN